jgi:hypothetical protein
MTLEQANDHNKPEAGTAQVAHATLAQEAFGKQAVSLPPAVTERDFKFTGGLSESVALDPKTGHPDTITFKQSGHSAELINYYDKNLHMTKQTLISDIHAGKRDTTTTAFDASGKATTITHAALTNNQLKSTDVSDIAKGTNVHDDFKTSELFKGCAPSHPHETVSHGKKIDSPSTGKDGKSLPGDFDSTVAILKKGFVAH